MNNKMYVYVIRSRNKDNKNLPGFHERAKTMVVYEQDEPKVYEEFKAFAAKGVPGEKTRLYRTVNARDEEKCRKELIIKLLCGASLTKMRSTLASACQQDKCRAESRWLFDFDSKDRNVLNDFVADVKVFTDVEVHETPNGYAIVTEHGFDTRELLNKYKDVEITLKKDELLFLDMIRKDDNNEKAN